MVVGISYVKLSPSITESLRFIEAGGQILVARMPISRNRDDCLISDVQFFNFVVVFLNSYKANMLSKFATSWKIVEDN